MGEWDGLGGCGNLFDWEAREEIGGDLIMLGGSVVVLAVVLLVGIVGIVGGAGKGKDLITCVC